MSDLLAQPLTLPCGAVLPNRIAKSAMTEGVASPDMHATERHERLYRTWSEGGSGLLISGNVMIDARVQERPGNIVVEPATAYRDGHPGFEALKRMAKAGTVAGNHLWMQISHAGRQSPWYVAKQPLAPSEVQLDLMGNYKKPRALTDAEIKDFIQRFADVAGVAKAAGFTGVQIHAAHGYLLSAFLSPITNQRTDEWGGSLANRARFLLEAIRATRAAVGPSFPVSVKLNSDDFRKGGFDFNDCLQLVEWLNLEGIDLLEISGGNYEQPRLLGVEGRAENAQTIKRASTLAREAYFIDYAQAIRRVAKMPLLMPGGFRSKQAMEEALSSGAVDVIGLARPLCTEPDLPARLLDGRSTQAPTDEQHLRLGGGFLSSQSSSFAVKMMNMLGQMGWFYAHIEDLADGKPLNRKRSVLAAFLRYLRHEYSRAWALRR